MLEWVISSAALTALIIALRFALKGKISLRLQYALWALVLLRLLIPVSFGATAFSIGNLTRRAAETEPGQAVSALLDTELPKMTYSAAYAEVAQAYAEKGVDIGEMPRSEFAETVDYEIMARMNGERSLVEVLKAVWLLGVGAVGLVLLASNLLFAAGLKKSRCMLAEPTSALPVYISAGVDTPCLFGLLHPAIYLTREAAADDTVLRHSVQHELTHFRHGDHVWAILRGVCLALHWYNPLVWWAAALSCRDAELACDEATVRKLGESERAEYGRTLIAMTCRKRSAALLLTATTMTGKNSSIRERILLLVKKPKTATCTLIAVILLAAVAAGCTFTGAKAREKAELAGNADDISHPPTLTLNTWDQHIEAARGSASWEYAHGDGSWSDTEVDSIHPLDEDGKSRMPRLLCTPSLLGRMKSTDVILGFSLRPDEVTVRCWEEQYWGDASNDDKAEIIPVSGEDFWIELKDGGCIYEVTARWSSHADYRGTVRYVFYAAFLPPVTPSDFVPVSTSPSFLRQTEDGAVPDVFSILSNDYPCRYDLTEAERAALWEMLCAAEYSPVAWESIAEEIDAYASEYALTGGYEGYYRISWYFEGAGVFHNAQLYPGNLINVGDWYRYDADSFDMALLRKLCDVPRTLYPKADEEIRDATEALKIYLEGSGTSAQQLRFDEQLCSLCMDIMLHAGPAGQRTKAKAEDTIVLLEQYGNETVPPEGRGQFFVLHRAKDGRWEFVGNYPIPLSY